MASAWGCASAPRKHGQPTAWPRGPVKGEAAGGRGEATLYGEHDHGIRIPLQGVQVQRSCRLEYTCTSDTTQ